MTFVRPLVALLTDYGQADSYVAEVKAAILTYAPSVRFVDVSHSVPPGDLATAQYLLARCWRRFPPGTVVLVVVDPGVGGSRRALAATNDGRGLVGPDNGVLTPALDGAAIAELPIPSDAAPTFHGRDVFAPAAARLAMGERLDALGRPIQDPVRLPRAAPVRHEDHVTGQVEYVDRFGTLITNVPVSWVAGNSSIIVGGRSVGALRRTFSDVPSRAFVAVSGSGGTVEIAVRDGSAAVVLGVGVGTEVEVQPETNQRPAR